MITQGGKRLSVIASLARAFTDKYGVIFYPDEWSGGIIVKGKYRTKLIPNEMWRDDELGQILAIVKSISREKA